MQKYYSSGSMQVAVRTVQGEEDTLQWLLSDHLGSTSTTANIDGTWNSTIQYSAFGCPRAARGVQRKIHASSGITPTEFRYTGQLRQAELGLYYYIARWYDPQIAHFTQADTIVPNAGDSAAYDRYAYVKNNPVKYTDPSGHYACDDIVGGRCISSNSGKSPYPKTRGALLGTNGALTKIMNQKKASGGQKQQAPEKSNYPKYVDNSIISTTGKLSIVTITTDNDIQQASFATKAQESYTGAGLKFGEIDLLKTSLGQYSAISSAEGAGILGDFNLFTTNGRYIIYGAAIVEERVSSGRYLSSIGITNTSPTSLTAVSIKIDTLNKISYYSFEDNYIYAHDRAVFPLHIPISNTYDTEVTLWLKSYGGTLPSNGVGRYPSISWYFDR